MSGRYWFTETQVSNTVTWMWTDDRYCCQVDIKIGQREMKAEIMNIAYPQILSVMQSADNDQTCYKVRKHDEIFLLMLLMDHVFFRVAWCGVKCWSSCNYSGESGGSEYWTSGQMSVKRIMLKIKLLLHLNDRNTFYMNARSLAGGGITYFIISYFIYEDMAAAGDEADDVHWK